MNKKKVIAENDESKKKKNNKYINYNKNKSTISLSVNFIRMPAVVTSDTKCRHNDPIPR